MEATPRDDSETLEPKPENVKRLSVPSYAVDREAPLEAKLEAMADVVLQMGANLDYIRASIEHRDKLEETNERAVRLLEIRVTDLEARVEALTKGAAA